MLSGIPTPKWLKIMYAGVGTFWIVGSWYEWIH